MSEAILGLEFGKPQAPPSMNGGDNPDNNDDQRPEEADDEDGPPPNKRSRHRKTVGFDSVTVYYFQRMQGFTCVPSQGGSTLGMSPLHVEKRTFSLRQHAHERRRLQFGEVDCSNTSSSSSLSPDDTAGSSAGDGGNAYQGGSSTLGAGEDTPEEDEGDDDDGETLSYLQPVPTRQRRALLRASGVRKIDALEKEECRDIRASREFCGCACKGRCLPETCSCSIAGISCQVDRLSFPCGCTQEGCGNTSGRTEFNPVRVRAHFVHTLMRLEFEKQQAAGNLAAYQCVDPHRLIYYNAAATAAATVNGTAAPGGMALPAAACHYSSEEEDEDDSSYSENSDYSTEEEEGDGTDLADGRPSSPHRDYTDLSCAVARGGGSPALASRGVVPVDPVFVGCGDCATDGLLVSPAEGSQAASSTSTTEEGSSSTATTDSTFGEIIKASLGEVATL
ncbi:cysteine/serine-rich nuclear protein 2-like isoform X1 [Dermacentor variabilis]|uniref:cysteine/serine-rich nuclear protein 2-like isoform X1 n=2 Tax=Dermacentor variabilis TaxID=34621 RepID=UPI003F5BF344